MQVSGPIVVRNEADIVRINVLRHLPPGIDQFLTVDTSSVDGTDRAFQDLVQTKQCAYVEANYERSYRRSSRKHALLADQRRSHCN